MKKQLIIVLILAFWGTAQNQLFAQGHDGNFGNEWIDYTLGKHYYKIKVFEDGMYRLDAAILQQAGANLGAVNLQGLQIFHEGQEIPIHVESSNGQLDYIQFYGRKNDGSFDINMYNDPTHHFNENYSLFNDTAAYFLTWGNSPSSLHYTNAVANLSNLPAKESYFMHNSLKVLSSTFNEGMKHPVSTEMLTKSILEYGEGFGSALNTSNNAVISTENVYAQGPSATASCKIFSNINGAGLHQIKIGNASYSTNNFSGHHVAEYTASVPLNSLQSTNTTVNSSGSNHYLAWASINYPRNFDFDGKAIFKFKLSANNSRRHVQLTNVDATNAAADQYYIYDLSNATRIKAFYTAANSMLISDLDPSATDCELVMINEGNPASLIDVVGVTPVNFVNYASPNFNAVNYLIITHASLKTNSAGNNPIFDYQAYRQSPQGGSYNTLDVDIDALYNQFSYGIVHHPLAIRNFCHFIKNNWTDPEYIFLIGKGREYQDVRGQASNLLIPTFGYPPSDNVMLASIDSDEPVIALGRLSALTGDQVSLYLQKIIDVETQRMAAQTLPDRGWTKNILHLGGGKNSGEQNLINNHLNAMKSKIEAPMCGGKVESFFKTSSSPIQVVQSTYLDSLINSGVSMITFFGHSSANSFDFNLDHPQNYNNYQKYPLIMALGCYGGTMYSSYPYISEDFVFEPQAGAGVFLASVGASALASLNNFAQEFYYNISNVHYNEGAAKSVKTAINRLESLSYTTTTQMVCNYMAYHGDPAYRVSNTEHPDYYIDENLVSHSPEVVTIQQGTFNLELDVYNLGKAVDSVITIRIDRTYPDNSSGFATSVQIQAPYFRTQVTIPIPIGNATALGINKFDIYIDSDNNVAEEPAPAAENNNEVLNYCVAILSDAVVPVYPYEFAIVPNTPISLKASTGNTFAVQQSYILQLDTTEYFNSPLLQSTNITQVGGLIEWTPSTNYLDSTVYYWRVSVDSSSIGGNFSWSTSSFIYLDGSYPGWNQSHFFQYKKDDHINLTLEEPDRKFNYITSIQTVSANTAKTPTVLHPENVAIYFNGSKLDKCRCSGQNGVYVAVIEPGTLEFWELPGPFNNSLYGAYNCDGAGRTTPTFLFKTQSSNGRDSLENFITNIVPDGHYVLAYTLNNAYGFAWSNSLKQAFTSHGALFVDSLANSSTPASGYPWATFFRKGDLSYIHNTSSIGASALDAISIAGSLEENWYQGNQKSTIIGPASNWYSMHWDDINVPTEESDVEVYGIDINQNTRTLLIPSPLNPVADPIESLTNIDPTIYPYLELVWNSLDSVNNTSPYINYWRILGDMVPEAALRPEYFLYFDSSCVQEGQELKLEIAFENISDIDMDSMLVKFELVGSGSPVYTRLDSLLSGDTLHASFSLSTINLVGNQQILIEINPNNDQPEKYFFNNIGLISFEVKRDAVNPLLDVTFDGIHIMNKDIVSGKPEIVVTLSDDNQYLGLDDLEDFRIILRHPNLENGEIALRPETTDMQFYPSDPTKLAEENKAKIIIHPELANDGMYTLYVSASDQSGNNSGQLSYSVDFEVINQPSISNMLNYPNPFSTATQFVFTLTGNELPDYMKIQILTVSGKVVREILQEELGTLRIGINRTEYAWDGKDMYGDQLANGVYLYRVITKKEGMNYESYGTRNDFMFRQGFGKMYLMR